MRGSILQTPSQEIGDQQSRGSDAGPSGRSGCGDLSGKRGVLGRNSNEFEEVILDNVGGLLSRGRRVQSQTPQGDAVRQRRSAPRRRPSYHNVSPQSAPATTRHRDVTPRWLEAMHDGVAAASLKRKGSQMSKESTDTLDLWQNEGSRRPRQRTKRRRWGPGRSLNKHFIFAVSVLPLLFMVVLFLYATYEEPGCTKTMQTPPGEFRSDCRLTAILTRSALVAYFAEEDIEFLSLSSNLSDRGAAVRHAHQTDYTLAPYDFAGGIPSVAKIFAAPLAIFPRSSKHAETPFLDGLKPLSFFQQEPPANVTDSPLLLKIQESEAVLRLFASLAGVLWISGALAIEAQLDMGIGL